MSDQLDQIQADYVPLEDRMLLKLRAGNKLYRAWLTRRYLGLLLPVLQGVHPATGERFAEPPAVDPELDERFTPQKEPPLEKRAETETLEYPLGEAPIVLTEVSFQTGQGDQPGHLMLKPAQGQGIVLPFTPQMNHLLLKLLLKALEHTDWLQPLRTRYYNVETDSSNGGSAPLQ